MKTKTLLAILAIGFMLAIAGAIANENAKSGKDKPEIPVNVTEKAGKKTSDDKDKFGNKTDEKGKKIGLMKGKKEKKIDNLPGIDMKNAKGNETKKKHEPANETADETSGNSGNTGDDVSTGNNTNKGAKIGDKAKDK